MLQLVLGKQLHQWISRSRVHECIWVLRRVDDELSLPVVPVWVVVRLRRIEIVCVDG